MRHLRPKVDKISTKIAKPPLAGGVVVAGCFFKLPLFPKLTNTDPFAAWFVVTRDATPDGIRVVRSVIGVPLSSEYGTHKTVKAGFWPWLSGKGLKSFKSRSF